MPPSRTSLVLTSILVLLCASRIACQNSTDQTPLTKTPPSHPLTSPATTKATTTTTTRATTTASTKPKKVVDESVAIDLAGDNGAFKPLAKGVHRLTPAVRLSPEMLRALKPLLEDPTPTLITLGNTVNFEGTFPGDKNHWAKWDDGVRELVNKHKGQAVHWEIWDEPDRKDSFKGSREDYFSAWVRTYHLIRSIDPSAVMAGPSISKHDGYLSEFLKVTKDYKAPPTIVCWHEEGAKPDIAGHITGTAESFWQDGTDRKWMRILQKSADAQRYAPSDPPLLLRSMHSAQRRNAWRGTRQDMGFKLTHLVTDKSEPRSLYYAYEAYAAMAAPPNREARTSAGVTADVIAAWNPEQRRATALIGRHFGRLGKDELPGKVSLTLRGLRGTHVRVIAKRLDDTGPRASKGPVPVQNVELPIKGELKLPLTNFGDRDAYLITITTRTAPTTTTAPATTTTATTR